MTILDLNNLSVKKLQEMLDAAALVESSCLALEKAGLNLVGECLKGQGTFYENSHYPQNDVFDADSKSQYYFHTHRGLSGEYGHFHTFLRAEGMPVNAVPITSIGKEPWPSGAEAISHLISISMNQEGYPIGLFTTNRWVTGEAWYSAEHVIEMLERFSIEHAYPNLAVNQWITAMFCLYRLEMVSLLRQRDSKINDWRIAHPKVDVFENRELEITSRIKIDVHQKVNEIKQALHKAQEKS